MPKLGCWILVILAVISFLAPVNAQSPAPDRQQQFADLGVCKLVDGQQITSCRLGYRTWGRLNAERSNAVLFPTWFSGTSASLADSIGPNGLVDPGKYFVVAVDALGDGVSSSPSNSRPRSTGPIFLRSPFRTW